jgi:hypothetical protein
MGPAPKESLVTAFRRRPATRSLEREVVRVFVRRARLRILRLRLRPALGLGDSRRFFRPGGCGLDDEVGAGQELVVGQDLGVVEVPSVLLEGLDPSGLVAEIAKVADEQDPLRLDGVGPFGV